MVGGWLVGGIMMKLGLGVEIKPLGGPIGRSGPSLFPVSLCCLVVVDLANFTLK